MKDSPIFIHSLFRAGSTYLYKVFNRSNEGYWCYQEPLHEIAIFARNNIEMLSEYSSAEIAAQLRHPELPETYFRQLYEVWPAWKEAVSSEAIYGGYFAPSNMDIGIDYWRVLIKAAKGRPVFQECRTASRIAAIMEKLGGYHIYLWRNPWDQWWSYKVSDYFDAVNQLIINAVKPPPPVLLMRNALGFYNHACDDIASAIAHFKTSPVSAENSYVCFYMLWCLGLKHGIENCQLMLNIDRLSDSKIYRNEVLRNLKTAGIGGINFFDCCVPQGYYFEQDVEFFSILEKKVHDWLRAGGWSQKNLERLEYIKNEFKPNSWSKPIESLGLSNLAEQAMRARNLSKYFETKVSEISCAKNKRTAKSENAIKPIEKMNSQIENKSYHCSWQDCSKEINNGGINSLVEKTKHNKQLFRPIKKCTALRQVQRRITIGIDARTFYYQESMSRGIGHYSLYHMIAVVKLLPEVEFILFVESLDYPKNFNDLFEAPNVKLKKVSDYDESDFDLFHICDPMNNLSWFDSPSRIFHHSMKTVTFYDLIPLKFYFNKWSKLQQDAYISRLDQYLSSNCHFLTISNYTKKDLISYGKICENRLTPIMAGRNRPLTPLNELKQSKINQIRSKFGITKPFFLHVGAHDPHKNFRGAYDAFVQCRKSCDVQFVIVGEKSSFLELNAQYAVRMKLMDLIFTGFISREDLGLLYKQAIALIFLSKFEGFGFPILEAMDNGCPVITSNVSSIPEVAGRAALMFDPENISGIADAMQTLCNDEKAREIIRIKGYEQAKNFSWEKTAIKTIDAWEKMLGFKLESKSNLVWCASFLNPSGYTSEALAFIQALSPYFPIALKNISKIESIDFISGLTNDIQKIINTQLNKNIKFDKKIVIIHFPAYAFMRIPEASYVIGRTMFETDSLPESWVEACSLLDEIWVPSKFNKETFCRSGVPKEKIRIVHEPIDTNHFNPSIHPPMNINARARFNFLSMFEWSTRKGWDILLHAYFSEFNRNDDVCLFIKTYNLHSPDVDARDSIKKKIKEYAIKNGFDLKSLPRYEIITKQIPYLDLPSFYLSFDCFVLPSRGEGWGRPYCESMSMELPTIGTNWSGNTEFMNYKNSYLIPINGLKEICDVEVPFYKGHHWAEPSVKGLKSIMRDVFSNPEDAKVRAKQARKDMVELYSCNAIGSTLYPILKEIGINGSISKKNRQHITWHGSQMVNHSLGLVNRELCLQLIEKGFDITVIPYIKENIFTKTDLRLKKIIKRIRKVPPAYSDVNVRHQWPPDLEPPERGYWVIIQPWEFGSLPKKWVHIMKAKVDELWVPTSYVRECFIRSGVPEYRVFVVPNGVNASLFNPQSTPYKLQTSKSFKFLFVGGTIQRKGIDILLDIYTKTFSSKDDVCLVIKDMGGSTFYKGQTAETLIEEYRSVHGAPEIEYIQEFLTEKDMAGLYTACDCLVHPYRGEGFGLPIAEAMASEIPVIVTGHGAALDFCTPDNSYLLAAKEIRLSEKKIGELDTVDYPWLAEPDRESLAAMMKRVIEFPAEAKEKARAARAAIETGFTWEKAANAVIRRVSELSLKPVVRFHHAAEIQQKASALTVSIIIRVSNDLKTLRKCFQNLREYTREPHEIIFVVNGANAKALKWVKRNAKENKNCRYIENKDGYGWAQEINHGIKESSGEHILILDYRAVVGENWLPEVLECMEHGLKPGIVGSMPQETSGSSSSYDKYSEALLQEAGNDSSFRERYRHRRILVQTVNAPCLLFKRGLVDEIGLMDERFDDRRFGVEDFCLRASLAGYQNTIAGDVWIPCHGQGKSADHSGARERWKTNRRIFNEKWHSPEIQRSFDRRLSIYYATAKADELFHKGQIEKATASMLEAIKKDPGDRNLYIKLSEMLIDAKSFDDARGILDSLPHAVNDSRRLALLGYCELGTGHNDKAQDYAERCLAVDPSMTLALNISGAVAYAQGKGGAAEGLFKKAIESDPGFGESYTNLGTVKWERGDHTEALGLFERAFILSPTVADVATAYHSAVCATGSFAKAQTVFHEAKALHPSDKRIAFLLIAVLLKQEKHDFAMSEIENAMVQFGVDDGILSAAMEIRAKIGPLGVRPGSRRKSVSVCMIVKNEESNIIKCLMSIKPVADEIIVVDTGSTDRTKAIASALGARVFDCPWTDDFSETRNFSLSKASGDWVLVLDADEVISPLDHASLRSFIYQADRSFAYCLTTRNYTYQVASQNWTANDGNYFQEEAGNGWLPSPKVRLFVNDKRIRFRNAVHELVEPTLKENGISIKDCNIPIHHYGRLDHDRVIAKGMEYYQLGKKKVQETEGDYNAIKELAIQASEIGAYEEAIPLWENLLTLNSKDPVVYLNLGYAHMKFSRYDQGLIYSRKAFELDPKSKETGLNCAGCELIAGDVNKAVSILEKVLEDNPDYPPALARLCAAYLIGGQQEAGLSHLERLRGLRFDCADALSEQARTFFSQNRLQDAIVLLEAAIQSKNINSEIHRLLAECRHKLASQVPLGGIHASDTATGEGAAGANECLT